MSNYGLIPFVKQGESRNKIKPQQRPIIRPSTSQLTGTEVRRFYEDVCSESNATIITKPQVTNRSSNKGSVSEVPAKRRAVAPKTIKDLFRASELGDTEAILSCLTCGVDINSTDEHGWTALMCAAVANKKRAVKILLHHDADRLLRNKKNLTAADLAQVRGNTAIVRVLSDFVHSEKQTSKPAPATTDPYHCDTCEIDVTDSTSTQHVTSTLHLFNSRAPVTEPSFGIPESNVGFQLMLKTGWDKNKGLGSEGQGQKYPVKTVLKRDRRGVGVRKRKEDRERVTHFAAGDVSAVSDVRRRQQRLAAKCSLKQKLSEKIRREKKIERDFRVQREYNCE